MSLNLKKRANLLRRALANSHGLHISVAQSLELVAKEENYPNWDSACASYGKAPQNDGAPTFHDMQVYVRSKDWSLSSIFEQGPEALADVRKKLNLAYGPGALVVVSGSTGQGKSTTASAILYDVKASNSGVGISIHDDRSEGTPSNRIVYVDEIRSFEHAFKALSLMQMGYKVVATMHAASSMQALDRLKCLLKCGIGDFAESIAWESCLFIHQQLTWHDFELRKKASDDRMRLVLEMHGYEVEKAEQIMQQGSNAVLEALLSTVRSAASKMA